MLVILTAYEAISSGFDPVVELATAITTIPIGSCFLYLFHSSWNKGLKKAEFYNDNLVVSGRNKKRTIKYGEIARMVVAKVNGFPLLGLQMMIFLEGEEKPLVIPRNVRKVRLRRGVYEWLQERTGLQHR